VRQVAAARRPRQLEPTRLAPLHAAEPAMEGGATAPRRQHAVAEEEEAGEDPRRAYARPPRGHGAGAAALRPRRRRPRAARRRPGAALAARNYFGDRTFDPRLRVIATKTRQGVRHGNLLARYQDDGRSVP